jgi:ADP-ribose pyrophosphatase YjhB (NUDIX family)
MYKKKLKSLLIKLVFPLVKLYWRILKPKTFGVKAIIVHPKDPGQILLIQHSYDDKKLWNLPGGGYNPNKETSIEAIKRELKEELAIIPINLIQLGEYKSDKEGKHDTVTIFLAQIPLDKFNLNYEISQVQWFSIDSLKEVSNIANLVLYSIQLYKNTNF